MQIFVERLLDSGTNVMDVGTPAKNPKDIMLLATKARMLAWLDDFLPPESEQRLKVIEDNVTRLRIFFKEHVKEELEKGLDLDSPDWACIEEELVLVEGRELPKSPEDVVRGALMLNECASH